MDIAEVFNEYKIDCENVLIVNRKLDLERSNARSEDRSPDGF
jgi:hypothetical protein